MNPIDIEIFNNLFQSVAEEMGVTLMRAAFSPNIKERRDHSCAIFDASGELLAQAAHIPVHLGSMPLSVQAAIGAVDMQPGESVVLNDPYHGGTHLPDLTLVEPVFAGDGTDPTPRPIFYVANRAHHADVGGISAGSLPISRHIDDEGIRISPTRLDADVRRRFVHASRTPDERIGDLAAQTAANRLGVRRLQALITRHTPGVLACRGEDLKSHAGHLMAEVVRAIPDGQYQATDLLDGDGCGNNDIVLRVVVGIDGDRCTIDFSDSADQVEGPVNAVRAITLSAVFYVARCLAPGSLPSNQGCLRPFEVITRPGSIVDAVWPAPVAVGNVETSQRLVDVLLRAFSQALPHRIPAASAGSMSNVCMGGKRPSGAFVYYETIGGGAGAGPSWHGASGVHTHMTNTLNTPVEAFEHAYPIRISRYTLRDGSGGPGRFTGGQGIEREYTFLEPTETTVLCERQRRGPWGLAGGSAGQPGRTTLIEAGGLEHTLRPKTTLHCRAGQRLLIQTPGGGGFGAPNGDQSTEH